MILSEVSPGSVQRIDFWLSLGGIQSLFLICIVMLWTILTVAKLAKEERRSNADQNTKCRQHSPSFHIGRGSLIRAAAENRSAQTSSEQ